MSMNLVNLAEAKEMFDYYMSHSKSKMFIVGGIVKDKVMFAIVEPKRLINNLTVQNGSKKEDNDRALRLAFTKDLKKYVKDHGLTLNVTVEQFEELAHNICSDGTNRGMAFEKLIFEHYGQKWEHDNKDYRFYHDIEINGIGFQIKTDKATFLNKSDMI